jgi:hypothetical protein
VFNETAYWESDWNGTKRFGEASGRSNGRLKEKDQKTVLGKKI